MSVSFLNSLDISQYSAFLFDLDGTLIAGSDSHFVECVRKTAEEFGHENLIIPPGHGLTVFLEQSLQNPKKEFIEDFRTRNKQRMLETPRPVSFHPDALRFMKQYGDIPRAIVTNCSDWELQLTEDVLDLREYFEVVTWKTPDIASKPAGDMYLRAAKMLQIAPQKCLVFEDSATGIAAGKNAGMTVVGIDRGTHREFSEADYVVHSFDELLS